MEVGASAADQALHLALFVAAAVILGVLALAVVERLADGGRRVVRGRHVALAIGALVVLAAAERLYHFFS